ncbi:hypothetical protein [Peribacillus simplex]|uniref:hypothetical protein n=1 Tax=Peribacillus simplex TaxID=1478 RepID=UPI0024C16C88|nr:hypothetical protein [Peribacillus simplex]WHX91277.1 hypothetical protein QNH50_25630 [Peribacillus simplex]
MYLEQILVSFALLLVNFTLLLVSFERILVNFTLLLVSLAKRYGSNRGHAMLFVVDASRP